MLLSISRISSLQFRFDNIHFRILIKEYRQPSYTIYLLYKMHLRVSFLIFISLKFFLVPKSFNFSFALHVHVLSQYICAYIDITSKVMIMGYLIFYVYCIFLCCKMFAFESQTIVDLSKKRNINTSSKYK